MLMWFPSYFILEAGGMKVLIQGLGEVPATVEFAIERERPDVTYIVCSKYQRTHIPRKHGYSSSNEIIIKKKAKKVRAKVQFQECDTFDPRAVSESLAEIMKQLGPEDELIINYTGGTAVVRLLLGAMAIALLDTFPTKIVYSVRYKGGVEKFDDQTEELQGIFKQLREFL